LPRRSTGDSEHLPLSVQTHLGLTLWLRHDPTETDTFQTLDAQLRR
jgi:hypothetical protein